MLTARGGAVAVLPAALLAQEGMGEKFAKALADGILEPDDYERLVAQLSLVADAPYVIHAT